MESTVNLISGWMATSSKEKRVYNRKQKRDTAAVLKYLKEMPSGKRGRLFLDA